MTRFRTRPQPAFAGDFPDSDRDITETLAAVQPAGWDGTTVTFSGEPRRCDFCGASGDDVELKVVKDIPGHPPFDACAGHDACMARMRQPSDPYRITFGGASAVGLDPDQVYRQAAPAPPYQPPATRHDDDTIARDMLQGWPHLTEVRCAFPAAASDTPIPCGRTHRDATAWTFRGLRTSAWAAGWHLDALGRWACPDCCQASGEYRTLYAVTVQSPKAALARLAGDPDGERWCRAVAEHDLFRSVRDARARHAGSPR